MTYEETARVAAAYRSKQTSAPGGIVKGRAAAMQKSPSRPANAADRETSETPQSDMNTRELADSRVLVAAGYQKKAGATATTSTGQDNAPSPVGNIDAVLKAAGYLRNHG